MRPVDPWTEENPISDYGLLCCTDIVLFSLTKTITKTWQKKLKQVPRFSGQELRILVTTCVLFSLFLWRALRLIRLMAVFNFNSCRLICCVTIFNAFKGFLLKHHFTHLHYFLTALNEELYAMHLVLTLWLLLDVLLCIDRHYFRCGFPTLSRHSWENPPGLYVTKTPL